MEMIYTFKHTMVETKFVKIITAMQSKANIYFNMYITIFITETYLTYT